MKHNKNVNPLLNLLINCISATSAAQILSIKGESHSKKNGNCTFTKEILNESFIFCAVCTFLFSHFLIIDLYNSTTIYLLDIILFLTVLT